MQERADAGNGIFGRRAEKALIGIVNSWNEYNPGHVHLKQVAGKSKGGEFGRQAVCQSRL